MNGQAITNNNQSSKRKFTDFSSDTECTIATKYKTKPTKPNDKDLFETKSVDENILESGYLNTSLLRLLQNTNTSEEEDETEENQSTNSDFDAYSEKSGDESMCSGCSSVIIEDEPSPLLEVYNLCPPADSSSNTRTNSDSV